LRPQAPTHATSSNEIAPLEAPSETEVEELVNMMLRKEEETDLGQLCP